MTLLEWPSSHVPSFEEPDIQVDAKFKKILGLIFVTHENTYPPPGDQIWACLTIQPFCIEPMHDLLKGVIIGIDIGGA